MTVRVRGEAVRRFILDQVEEHPFDIARVTAAQFRITRQAVNKHLQQLVAGGALTQHGKTRNRSYELAPQVQKQLRYSITPALAEDRVWREDISSLVGQLPQNVLDIWHYGFTEMFNNAIDHSEGKRITVDVRRTASATQIEVSDDGIGIFRKIQTALGLIDERHAVLELAKGKLTTDPAHHTGEGIFFASRMFDNFAILSGGVFFSHEFGAVEDYILESDKRSVGTVVHMGLNNHTARTTRKIFDQFSSGEYYGFTKTVVPVRLAQYGDETLVSRSQAKRLLTRVERFKTVVLDFRGVEAIGQAFGDEIFRVFPKQHPNVELVEINACSAVKRMIVRARSAE